MLVHLLIIAPVLGSAPINQLLATGGVLFFLQSFATLVFGTEFRNIGMRLPIIELGDIFISYARLLAFAHRARRRGRCSMSFCSAPSSAPRSARSRRTATSSA